MYCYVLYWVYIAMALVHALVYGCNDPPYAVGRKCCGTLANVGITYDHIVVRYY